MTILLRAPSICHEARTSRWKWSDRTNAGYTNTEGMPNPLQFALTAKEFDDGSPSLPQQKAKETMVVAIETNH